MLNRRERLAFILAPLLPSVFLLFALHLYDNPRLAALVLLFSITFSYLPCLLLGMPLMKFLKRRNYLSIVNMALFGALAGAVTFYIFGFVLSFVLGSSKSIIPEMEELVSGALFGDLVAISFSVIAGFPLFSPKKQRPSQNVNISG